MPSTEHDDQDGVAAALPFSGQPRTYLRIAVFGSVALHVYLFAGYWAIQVFVVGHSWPRGWFPVAATVVSAVVTSRVAYRWIMRIDAQYGRGSGWALESTRLKLPWELARGRRRPRG